MPCLQCVGRKAVSEPLLAQRTQAQAQGAEGGQASCWSMNAVSWALLMAPTLVAAS